MKTVPIRHFAMSLALVVGASSFAAAQPAVTQRDVAYEDDDEAQVLDVYLAKSDTPTPAMIYIHGGGWRAGSKNRVPAWLSSFVNEGVLSVISVEYRFTNVAPHPAQVNDCVRAIQFVRSNAEKWNIDPKRIGVTGGSAGGHLSLWVALHDDAAKPDAADPIERESSRVACAVSFAGPTDWSLLSEIEHAHPAYRMLLGLAPNTPAADIPEKATASVSPITYVSKDDPAIMQVHGDNDAIVPIQHARRMHERLKETGVPSELVVIVGANHGVAGARENVARRPAAFVRERLLK